MKTLEQLLLKYNSYHQVKARTHHATFETLYSNKESFESDIDQIKRISQDLLDYQKPLVTIIIPCYNEELELIPTILTFLYSIADAEIPVELIAVDNNSSDRTNELLESMGIKTVPCESPGLRFARSAGLDAAHNNSEYVWLVDADTRTLPPSRKNVLPVCRNPLKVSFEYMQANQNCVAISTGIVFEYQIPLRRIIRSLRIMILGGNSFSCWTGPNQFIRKEHLLAIGGIDIEVDGGEDHHRIFQLRRYAKQTKNLFLAGADRNPELLALVYTSDRRNSSLRQIYRNVKQQLSMPEYPKDEYGLPIHPKGTRHKDLYRRERGEGK